MENHDKKIMVFYFVLKNSGFYDTIWKIMKISKNFDKNNGFLILFKNNKEPRFYLKNSGIFKEFEKLMVFGYNLVFS